jgi:xylulokinase
VSEPLLLGIDVGTTRVKVGAFHLDGRPAAIAHANYSLTFDPINNGAEQDATEWSRRTTHAMRQVISEIDPSTLIAISVGGQGPTVVALNDMLEPVSPALTWMDRRAFQETQQLSARVNRAVPVHAYLPKVMWLKNARSEVYGAARWFCQSWDFVAAQLIGTPIVSTTPGIAPWSDDWLDAAELDRAKFPESRRMGEQLGCVTTEAARLTGLPAGLPVIGGISDYFEGIIGSGAMQRGMACDNGGASSSFNVCWDSALDVSGVFCIPSFAEGYWYIGGPASTTGKALDWWRQDVLGCPIYDWSLLQEAVTVEPGSARLIFLPYLAGERAPLWNAQARGVFFGLSLQHRRAHMTRAILESVAYALTHLLEQIENIGAQVDEIHTCGGQANSELWSHIKADVTGRRVVLPQVPDAAVLGAAIIAGIGVGAFDDFIEGAHRMVRARRVIEPNTENHARYREMYSLYRDLYTSVQPLYERLSRVN